MTVLNITRTPTTIQIDRVGPGAVASAASAAAALVSETNSAASAAAALADRILADADAQSASDDAAIAAAAQEAIEAIATQSGISNYYDTYALALADIAGIAADEVILIYADENNADRPALYQKLAGVLTEKLILYPQPLTIYVDSVGGNDSNSGRTASAAVLTLATAVSKLLAGDTLALARGSRFYETLDSDALAYIKIRAYGRGPRPVIDGSRQITDAWTLDTDATYYNDVTHEVACDTVTPLAADTAWFYLWLEKAGTKPVGLTPYFDGGTQAANIAYVKANPGTFTCYQSGSAAADPRIDTTGTRLNYRYYAHLADDGDPDATGTEIFYGEYQQVASLGYGFECENIVFQRTITKDMTGGGSGASGGGGSFKNCAWYQSAVHGWVGHAVGEGIRIVTDRASAYTYGGGWHNFRNTTTFGSSPGVSLQNAYLEGYNNLYYGHGSASADSVHDQINLKNIRGKRCGTAFNFPMVANFAEVDGFDITDFTNMTSGGGDGTGGNIILKNGKGLSVEDSSDCVIFEMAADYTVDNCTFILRNTGARNLCRNTPAQLTSNASLFYTLTATGSTFVGAEWTNNTYWQQVNIVATDCIMGELSENEKAGGDNLNRTMTLANCSFSYKVRNLAGVQADFSDVGNDCIMPWQAQIATQTVASGDIAYRDTTRTASMTSGADVITFNADPSIVIGQQIKVLDSDGVGGTFETTIIAETSTTIYQTADLAPDTFASKAVHSAHLVGPFFSDAESVTTGTLSNDGLTLTVADDTMIDAATILYLKGIGRRPDFGVVKVTSKAGAALTLPTAVDWLLATAGMNAAVPLPSIDIQYKFPIGLETVILNIDRAAGVGDVVDLGETTDTRGRLNDADYRRLADFTSASGGGSILHERGVIDLAVPVAVGDIVTIAANVYVQDYAPIFVGVPARSGLALLTPGALTAAGMGARA